MPKAQINVCRDDSKTYVNGPRAAHIFVFPSTSQVRPKIYAKLTALACAELTGKLTETFYECRFHVQGT